MTTDEMAGLPEELRGAIEYCDDIFDDADNGEWAVVRAELLRLAQMIAGAPTTELHWLDTSWASRPFKPELQRLIGQRVALLPVGGEG